MVEDATPRVALVTGGSRGIGLEVARQLARRGMTVAIGAREASKGEAEGRNLEARAFVPDLADRTSVARVAGKIASGFGLSCGLTAASYAISKAALNALTSKLAAELDGSGVLVNTVDPGLTATAPGIEAMGARPVPEGAAGLVWAATLPDNGPTGGFFRDGKPLSW